MARVVTLTVMVAAMKGMFGAGLQNEDMPKISETCSQQDFEFLSKTMASIDNNANGDNLKHHKGG